MSAAPAVSVCIPVRNGADQLRHTLINLLIHSNYPADRWEVVLGDHDSADETAGIIAGFQERFPRVRSVRVPFTGANRASVRNRLIEESRGDLLVFIDHDVLASDDFLWKHVAAHERLPSSIVAGAIFGTFLERDLGRFGGQLELDHITASYDVLTSHPELADPRMGPASPADLADPVDVRDAPAPFRLFYGGNLSAYRSDIEACGRFDECYDGWGLEDDDFAQQFRVAGRGMAFSPGAWGFHMPGAGHDWNHLGFWRRNFETFFRKFTTREIEQYALYGGALLPLGMAHMESLLHRLRAIDTQGTAARVAGLLGPPRGRRLCHFVRDDTTAQALRLTDALQPFGPWTDTQREQSGTRWWPLVGIKTPFAGEEIDEVVVLVDVMMWLDHSLLTLVLSETARIARRVVFCCGAAASARASGFPVQTFRETVQTLRFSNPCWIDVIGG